MATTTPSPPHEDMVDTDNQPPATESPPPSSIPSPSSPTELVQAPISPAEEEDHQQEELINSNPPYSPSLNSVNPQLPEYSVASCQLPPPEQTDSHQEPPPVDAPLPEEQIDSFNRQGESDGHQEPPPEEQQQIMDYQLSPPKVTEPPPQNPNPNPSPNSEPVIEQTPSPLLLAPSLEHKDPPGSPKVDTNPKKDESPIEKQLETPEFNASLDNEPSKKTESPIVKDKYAAAFDSCFDNEPLKKADSPEHDFEADFNAIFDDQVKREDGSKQQELPKEDMPTPQLPLGVPMLLHAVASASPVRPQISAWTHEETVNLIQAYQEKWYSIKKGPLKAGQWEEVAVTVAARCGYDEPTKTSKQCRHKLEKLRKRYRAERMNSRSKANSWSFFKMMDNMERGPLPISSSPMELVEYQKPSGSNGRKRKNDDVGGGVGVGVSGEFLVNKRSTRARSSISHGVVNGGLASNLRLPSFPDGGSRIKKGLRTPMVQKRRGFYQGYDGGEKEHNKVEKEDDDSDSSGDEEEVATQLATEIKGFAEKFVKMENKKLEMMRDVERYRLEMENKRTEMILQSQRMLVETVNKAFGGPHKPHKLSAK